jgi:hypothetical protein
MRQPQIGGACFSLRGLVLARTNPRKLKRAPLAHKKSEPPLLQSLNTQAVRKFIESLAL